MHGEEGQIHVVRKTKELNVREGKSEKGKRGALYVRQREREDVTPSQQSMVDVNDARKFDGEKR